MVHKEYEQGYDQFHQSESYIYFYFLCLADPSHERNRERARRFAGFYLNEDPEAPNYDPALRLIRAAHNGSRGPRYGYTDVDPPTYGYAPGMATYGLPFADLPDIDTYEDLREPEKALRMGRAMQERMGRGDVAGNLGVASLIANAFLLTGEDQYRAWITEYLSAWQERADANGGLIPDNVGLSGEVGEYLDGRWYGGLYGWTWPHGYYNIGQAAAVTGQATALLTGDNRLAEPGPRPLRLHHGSGGIPGSGPRTYEPTRPLGGSARFTRPQRERIPRPLPLWRRWLVRLAAHGPNASLRPLECLRLGGGPRAYPQAAAGGKRRLVRRCLLPPQGRLRP